MFESGGRHERVGADFLLEAPAEVDGGFDGSDLGDGDGVRERRAGRRALAQERRESLLAAVDEPLERRRLSFSLREERPELRDRAERGLCARPREVRQRLGVAVRLCHGEELRAVRERRLRDRHAARVEPLPDHLEGRDALCRHFVLALLGHVRVCVEQRLDFFSFFLFFFPSFFLLFFVKTFRWG